MRPQPFFTFWGTMQAPPDIHGPWSRRVAAEVQHEAFATVATVAKGARRAKGLALMSVDPQAILTAPRAIPVLTPISCRVCPPCVRRKAKGRTLGPAYLATL